ncbi:hypothetical protein TNCT_121391 [Trichonephila clavata]|uniref:Uncharacterized protein n=1 Tax=Trichonephila clavata TaxID=2740835 RepID=A0A8X6KLR1_TRICU|nr:hypothetical protein TNCT_121391 [Trichonephila clavata]
MSSCLPIYSRTAKTSYKPHIKTPSNSPSRLRAYSNSQWESVARPIGKLAFLPSEDFTFLPVILNFPDTSPTPVNFPQIPITPSTRRFALRKDTFNSPFSWQSRISITS